LEVQAKAGGGVTLENPSAGVSDAVNQAYSVFGGEGTTLDVYSLGGYDSIMGHATVLFPSEDSGLVAQVDEDWRFAHVAPELGFVPGFVNGTVTGPVNDGTHIAVALNGSVKTVVPIFDVRDDRAKFSAVLPEGGFKSGFNDLDLFAVSGPHDQPVVRTIEFADGHRFQLQRGAEGQVVAVSDSTGESWDIVDQTAIRGSIDEAFWEASGFTRSELEDLHVAGWAVNEATHRPADQIVIFANGVFAGTTTLERERPDMQEAYQSDHALMSGFRTSLSQFVPAASLDIRAYALSDGVAAELAITDQARTDIDEGQFAPVR
jgi:hypothetical protein